MQSEFDGFSPQWISKQFAQTSMYYRTLITLIFASRQFEVKFYPTSALSHSDLMLVSLMAL